LTQEHRNKLDRWIMTIEVKGRGLTPWEDEFVESIKTQLEKKGTCSIKQEEILERIYSEKTPL